MASKKIKFAICQIITQERLICGSSIVYFKNIWKSMETTIFEFTD